MVLAKVARNTGITAEDLVNLEGARITLNEYLDQWLETPVKPRVRENTCQDYEAMMRRYVRPPGSSKATSSGVD